jgi:hypothetical protein
MYSDFAQSSLHYYGLYCTCRSGSSQLRHDGTYALGGATCVLQPQQPFIIWWQSVPEKCIQFIGRQGVVAPVVMKFMWRDGKDTRIDRFGLSLNRG